MLQRLVQLHGNVSQLASFVLRLNCHPHRKRKLSSTNNNVHPAVAHCRPRLASLCGAPCPLCHDPDTVSDGRNRCKDGGNESVSDGHSADHGGNDNNCSSYSNVGNDSNGGRDSGNGSVGGSAGNSSNGCGSDSSCSSSQRLRYRCALPVQASVK